MDTRQLRAWHQMALDHLDHGRLSAAEEVFRQAAQEFPLAEPIRAGLAHVLLLQGQFEAARQEAIRMCEHRTLYASAKLVLSEVALHDEDLSEVRRHLEDAVRYQPDQRAPLEALSRFFFEHGPLEEAEVALCELLRRDPNDAIAQCNLATALLCAGRSSEARRAYERVLQLQPENATARHNSRLLEQRLSKENTVVGATSASVAHA